LPEGAKSTGVPVVHDTAEKSFDRVIGELRPHLHRYCARMTGSVIDGDDVVQQALVNAVEADVKPQTILHLEAWLIRIAHNAALDFLRRRARQTTLLADEDPEMSIDPSATADSQVVAAASLRTFMRLPVAQRSSVILKDVLGYSIEEIGAITEGSVPGVKAALHRGRARLRQFAREPDDEPLPTLAEPERARLAAYVERFNARDFDAVRDMLADDVRLDLVGRLRFEGRDKVGAYFGNYAQHRNWRFAAALVDRQPAIIVQDPDDPDGRPRYFVVLGWAGDKLVTIRDFVFARYALDGAEVVLLA
jgi:RNA polymerase sigma-70 factor (ECF subfamily)